MKKLRWIISVLLLFYSTFIDAQKKDIKFREFFTDERMVHVKITTDIKNLLSEKKSLKEVDALVTCTFPDSSKIEENIKIQQRGHFRRDNCYLSSLTLLFNSKPSNKLAPLKRLKLVGGCGKTSGEEQYLFKEYLIYKMYNLLTDFSFRARLIQLTYVDTKNKVKSFSQCAFFLEDIDAVAKRNKYQQKKFVQYSPARTHRFQTALMSVFQYMIGNTDWSIPFYHNIRLVVPKSDTNSVPLPIAYDFDVTGLVNPEYGGPPLDMGIENLTDRLYRGFPVTQEEIQSVVDLMLQKEQKIFSLINSFELLNKKNKKEMIYFLQDFFSIIKNKSMVKNIFITNARKE